MFRRDAPPGASPETRKSPRRCAGGFGMLIQLRSLLQTSFRPGRSDDFFRRHADYVLENNGAPEMLRPSLLRILEEVGVLRT